jgi:hypothetical protein
VTDLESRVKAIEDRNLAVESDKKFEGSWQRKLGVILITYSTMVLVFTQLQLGGNPFVQSIIPTLGYTLSTLGLSWLKRFMK